MRIQSKPCRVVSGSATQVGACCVYFVLLFQPNRPSLQSYVASGTGAGSRGPTETKWKTSQRKQERYYVHITLLESQESSSSPCQCPDGGKKNVHPFFSPGVPLLQLVALWT